MNPVDLIRELADALEHYECPREAASLCRPESYTSARESVAHQCKELLTRARAFLEQARVIEMGERYTSGDGLLFLHGIETDVPDDTPCTVHVVVQVGSER